MAQSFDEEWDQHMYHHLVEKRTGLIFIPGSEEGEHLTITDIAEVVGPRSRPVFEAVLATVPHEKPCTSLKDFNYKFNEEDVLVNASTGVVQPAARALFSAATLTCFPELPRHAFQVHRSTLCRSATTRHSAT